MAHNYFKHCVMIESVVAVRALQNDLIIESFVTGFVPEQSSYSHPRSTGKLYVWTAYVSLGRAFVAQV